MGAARVGDVARAERVGEHAFDRIGLDHRHVLHRGGMEDELGPLGGHHPRRSGARSRTSPMQRLARQRAEGAPRSPGRWCRARTRCCRAAPAAPGRAPAIWRASSLPIGAAGAGHQHAPARDQRAHARGRAPSAAGRADLRSPPAATSIVRASVRLEFGEPRQARERSCRRVGRQIEKPAHRRAVELICGQRSSAAAAVAASASSATTAGSPRRKCRAPATPRDVAPDAPQPSRDDADHAIGPVRVPRHRADEEFGAVAVRRPAAPEPRESRSRASDAAEAAVLGDAIGKARPAQQRRSARAS